MTSRVLSWFHSFYDADRPRVECRGVAPAVHVEKRSEHPNLKYDDEDAAREAIRIVEPFTMLSYQRLVTLWQQVRYVDRVAISGALVECGTWKGGASGMMALAHLHSGVPSRTLHLFDSFQGLPEPDRATDGEMAVHYASEQASGALRTIGKCVGALEDNKRLLGDLVGYPSELTQYHVGWFQDTLRVVPDCMDAIAVLRIDGDWYESTKVCLETLVSRVSSGGIVVIDDYGKWAGCRKAVDEFMAVLPRSLFLNHIDAAGRYFIVP